MNKMASQITSLMIVYSTVYSGTDQRKHQSSASLAFVRGIHRRPDNSPHKRASNAKNVSIWWRHHVHYALVAGFLFLLADGIHLTRAATNKLVSSLQLVLRHGETSAHTDRRHRDQVATSHADPEQHQDDDDFRHPFWQQSRRKAARHSHGQNRPAYDHASGPRQGAAAPRPQQNRQSASAAYLPPHAHARRPHGWGPGNSQRLGAPNDAPQRHNAPYRPPTPLAPTNAEARSSRLVADQHRFPLVPRSPSPPNRNISGPPRRHILPAPHLNIPTVCQLCLGKDHSAVTCKSRDCVCNKCNQRGHFARACVL